MNLVTQIAAGLYAVILVAVGTLEIFAHGDQRFRSIFYVEPGTERAVRMWAMNVGMYNILTALGIGAGIWLGNSGGEARLQASASSWSPLRRTSSLARGYGAPSTACGRAQ